jgi:hypothetical protein
LLAGGLAAAAIAHESALFAAALSLLVAVAAAVALSFGLLDDRRRRSGHQVSEPDGHQAGAVQPTAPMPVPGTPGEVARSMPPAEPVRPAVVRVLQDPSAPAWWQEQRPAGPARKGGRAAAGPRAVPLSEFLDQALIAQCPRCGSFRVGADNRAAEWLFGCEECGQRWTWQPGSPWPAVQVRPNARRRAD